MSDDVAGQRLWEMNNDIPEPIGHYPTLDEYAAALAEVQRMESVEAARAELAATQARLTEERLKQQAEQADRYIAVNDIRMGVSSVTPVYAECSLLSTQAFFQTGVSSRVNFSSASTHAWTTRVQPYRAHSVTGISS